MITNEEIKTEKEKLREQLKECNYKIWVFNSYRGLNWDKSESKGFILAFPFKNEIKTLNPFFLKNLGWNRHFKESYAEHDLFYDGVLGMSRAFNIVYNLSTWLFSDLSKDEIKAICEKEDLGYILTNR